MCASQIYISQSWYYAWQARIQKIYIDVCQSDLYIMCSVKLMLECGAFILFNYCFYFIFYLLFYSFFIYFTIIIYLNTSVLLKWGSAIQQQW